MIHTNITCDSDGCKACVGIGFDAFGETWGSLVDAIKASGWAISGGPGQGSMRCYCPKCRAGFFVVGETAVAHQVEIDGVPAFVIEDDDGDLHQI